MAKKNINDRVEIEGEFTLLPGYSLEDINDINLEEVISEKLNDAGYDVYQSFDYKIVIKPKK